MNSQSFCFSIVHGMLQLAIKLYVYMQSLIHETQGYYFTIT